jgi:hypothetical protein
LPAWEATTVQVPVASSVSVVLLTVHTVGVVELKVTGSPDDAVALSLTGDWANVFLEMVENEIVCDTPDTVKLRVTLAAAA